ncbi:hypothetical protein N2152v2_007124 [Parachlorella kessleri]
MTSPLRCLVITSVFGLLASVRGVELNTTGPACKALPSTILGLLQTISAPPAGQLCPWILGDSLACTKLAFLSTSLEGDPNRIPTCAAGAQVEPIGSPTAFEDVRPLPRDLSNATDLIEAEGATWAWLYRNVVNLAIYTGCAASGNAKETLLVPAGWELVSILNFTDPTGRSNVGPVPFAAIFHQPQERQLAVIVRGTVFGFEWVLDFAWNQTTEYSRYLGNTSVHWGVAEVYQQLWPGVEDALRTLVVEQGAVFVTGHSLGSGVGTLLSLGIQSYLDEQLGADVAPVVSASLAAPLNVGGPEFVDYYNQRVNARRIAFVYDSIPQVPCEPAFPACTQKDVLLSQFSVVPTDQPGNAKEWSYEAIGGGVVFTPAELPQDSEAWSAVSILQVCWVNNYFSATHGCSYNCFFSQFVPGYEANNSCWLSEKPNGITGSQCNGWPTNYPIAA